MKWINFNLGILFEKELDGKHFEKCGFSILKEFLKKKKIDYEEKSTQTVYIEEHID